MVAMNNVITSSIFTIVGIAVAGGCGATLRFFLDTCVKEAWKGTFPLSTLVINALASLAAGAVAALAFRSIGTIGTPLVHTVIATGLLGGFSTFSTFINETVTLLRKHHIITGIANIVCEIVVPWICVAIGWAIFS